MSNPRECCTKITFFAFLVGASLLLCGVASAAPSFTLSKISGPSTSRLIVWGCGFQPDLGMNLLFDTKEKALVVASRTLERNNDKGVQRPFLVQTDWNLEWGRVYAEPRVTSIGPPNQLGEEAMRPISEKLVFAVQTFSSSEYFADRATTSPGACERQMFDLDAQESPAILGNKPGEDSRNQLSDQRLRSAKPADFNRDIYYRNKLEFSLDIGWLPINIPFPLDVFVGDVYNTYPLKYTLVPIIASLRWHMNGVGGPWALRGNWDLTFSGSVTAIPRGPESRYFSYIMGIRRNFVQRNWRIAPYFDVRLGLGNIDAKGPDGVQYAQGEDFTFTVNMGSGVRYNFNPRYAISAGMNFMHISNLDLSQGNGKPNWGVVNYGINVYGPMLGIDIQLRRHPRHSEQ